jgi:hypothetical protein
MWQLVVELLTKSYARPRAPHLVPGGVICSRHYPMNRLVGRQGHLLHCPRCEWRAGRDEAGVTSNRRFVP